MYLAIRKNVLSDKSETFDVILKQYNNEIVIPAYSDIEAEFIRDAIQNVVDKHSTEIVVNN